MKDKIRSFYHENKALIRFLSSAFVLYILWVVASTFFQDFVYDMHYHIIKPQADISAFFLRLMGYEIDQDYMVNGCEARLVFAGHGSICVGTNCSGLELFLLFFGFILLMPGRWIDKLWYIPAGFLAILLLNIIRIISLGIIYYHAPEYLDFNHT